MGTALPDLIQHMLQPEFYPHGVQGAIQLLQTHISYVVLTGEYAYKIKKPISFGFLDFTTLEKRRFFCQEELRLNQRLSPTLYLSVQAITYRDGCYQLAPADSVIESVVEYAVLMRQFSQDRLFSQLFQSGQLTLQLVQELGAVVARAHSIAPTSAEIQAFGSSSAVQQVCENNYSISEPYIGRVQTQSQYAETRAFTTAFYQRHGDWFLQRQIDGKIRECHGDLHLNNVCLYQNTIQIFDCIEFNQEFRNIDIIYDAAFLVMDLEFQGRVDLANLFLNTYLEQTGDYWSAALLPLYLSMRAYIRANVNALTLDDPSIAEAEKPQVLQRAQDYYRLAWRYSKPVLGRIILMSGLSGSGKSTVARQVAQQLNAIHIRSDAVRKRISGIPLQSRGAQEGTVNEGIYTPEMTQLTYERMLELGIFLAQQGWPVILDAKYDRKSLRYPVLEAAQAAQLLVHIVSCTAPIEVLRDRLEHRTESISDATASLLESQIQSTEPFTADEQSITTLLHTEQKLDVQLGSLLAKLLAPS